ncbi:MAG: hypothetical protein K2X93_25040 [Candidatus Obscuribacterales bacterium]|nr:hypothetical protein [Candidatus Obscuribacterales bacterium]
MSEEAADVFYPRITPSTSIQKRTRTMLLAVSYDQSLLLVALQLVTILVGAIVTKMVFDYQDDFATPPHPKCAITVGLLYLLSIAASLLFPLYGFWVLGVALVPPGLALCILVSFELTNPNW